MTPRLPSPRQRFIAMMRRAPYVAKEILRFDCEFLRRCSTCQEIMVEDDDHYHWDASTKYWWTHRCRSCRNKRDRDRYHEEKKDRRTPVGRHTQHLTHHWCPHCGATQEGCCDVHKIQINQARATGSSVEPGEKLPPNSVHLDLECDLGRGMKRYDVTLILGPSLHGVVPDGPLDIETGEMTGGFLDEVESARFLIGEMWVQIPSTNVEALRQLHACGVAVHKYLWGK